MINHDPTLLGVGPNPVRSTLFLFICAGFAAFAPAQEKGQVETILESWHDAKRDRDVPVKIYLPKSTGAVQEKSPVIIFSHGLGGSREGYQYVGEFWAANGFVSVHLQHIGSDDSVWKGAKTKLEGIASLRRAAGFKQFVDRPADVSFVIDELRKYEKLKGKIDLEKIGMAGHSFGGLTTQAIAGQVFPLFGGMEKSFGDDRIKAAIVMSPQAPRKKANHELAFSKTKIPVMFLTGTLDASPLDPNFDPADREIPFQKVKDTPKYLIVFEKGDHMLFGGSTKGPRATANLSKEELAAYHQHIKKATLLFWKAWLSGDEKAKLQLNSDSGLKAELGDSVAKYEHE